MGTDKTFYLSDDVRKQNRFRILSKFRQFGDQSRTEIGRLTELSPGTVTNVTTTLLNDAIIDTRKPTSALSTNRHGRPRVQLGLNPEYNYLAAGSLTFNRIRLNVLDYSGKTVLTAQAELNTNTSDGITIAKTIADMLSDLPKNVWPSKFIIGVQGLTANDGNQILWSPILSDSGRGFASELAKLTGADVIVENDCAMIARSLSTEPDRQDTSFAAVLLSYGIGMGLYINGSPFQGTHSSASELGHIPYRRREGALCRCGKRGCVEAYASDYGIWRTAHQKGGDFLPDDEMTSEGIAQIIATAQAEDGPSRHAIEEAGRAIGHGLATMFGLFDPFPVVFIGREAEALSLMEDEIRSAIAENFRFQKQLNVKFTTEDDALFHIEKGCAIIGLDYLDQQAAFGL